MGSVADKTRCEWVSDDPLYCAYHDTEWGVPVHDDRRLFEMLMLEGQQAGLSWITVLKRREHYQKAFFAFDAKKIVNISQTEFDVLMQNPGLIRHARKLAAIIQNAKAYLAMTDQGENFTDWLWSFVDGQPVVNEWPEASAVPVMTAQSKAMSSALKKRGFAFVGPTICYAFMQAVGMVWDHSGECFLAR